MAFLSNFARQPWLPWNSRRTPIAYWSRLAFHNSIRVAWLSRGSGGPRRALESISSAWSWQRLPWKSLVTFFSSFTRVARSTSLPWYRDAWRALQAWWPWETFGAWLSSQPWRPWVPLLAFLSQGSCADHNSRWAWETYFTFVSLKTFSAWGSWVPWVTG